MSSLTDETYWMDKTYELEELREVFPKILETQPEFINIQSMESQYNVANGIYKLFPYYQKLSPNQQLTTEDSRFIIHKHVISGQWQLTEFYAYPFSKNIKAFPVTEKNENDALLNNLVKSHKIEKLETEVQSKNETIELLKNRNGLLKYQIEENRREIARQPTINKELELKLIQKQKKICDLENKLKTNDFLFSALSSPQNAKVIETENRSQRRSKTFGSNENHKELKSKLIEKENEISNLYKTQDELKSKLSEKENELCHLYKNHEKIKSKFSKKHKYQEELKSKLSEKENEIFYFNESQKKLESKLIEKENEIHHIYETQLELNLTPKENQILDSEHKIQSFKNIMNKQNETNQEKITLKQIELIEEAKQITNEKLSKYQKLNEKLESENITLKETVKVLKEITKDHETSLKELTENLQNIDNIILETSSTNDRVELRQSQHKDKKENLHQCDSQIEQNQELSKSEDDERIQNLENDSPLPQIHSMFSDPGLLASLAKVKETLQKSTLMMRTHYESFKLAKQQNKKYFENERISHEIQESFKLEKHESNQNLKYKITRANLQKYEPLKIEDQKKKKILVRLVKSLSEISLDRKIIKLSKEEKQIKSNVGKKQNKILNAIQTILLESMPSTNETQSLVENEIFELKKKGYMTLVCVFMQNLQAQEDENLILKIKSCLDKKNMIMTNTDPNYQYESMLMHIGAINYARCKTRMINTSIANGTMDGCLEENRESFAELNELGIKHKTILDNMLESVRDEKMKTKIKCLEESECLYESHKYKYESFLRTIGLIVYGYGNTLSL